MIDIHCHILPGLDDGANDMDEALDMADMAVESGVTTICVTPHTNLLQFFDDNYESKQLEDAFLEFQDALKAEHIPLRVVRGCEIFVTPGVVDLVKQGMITTMNHTKHCLIEFDFEEKAEFIESTIREFVDAGFRPVVAHPERYYCVQDHPYQIFDWMREGALTQINKGSVLGRFGKDCERCADYLLDMQAVTCISSDAHSPFRRTTDMREISEYIAREYSMQYRDELLYYNPGKIIGVETEELPMRERY